MQQRELGNGLRTSAIGLGCMGMSEFYGPTDETQSITTLRRAIDLGVTFWDTSDAYGVNGHNERLLGRVLSAHRDEVVVATKFGFVRDADGEWLGLSGRTEHVRAACERSLDRLGIERIDLYYQHRVDPEVPIEETIGAMAELVAAGKIAHLGLSEASAETLRRAAVVHPIAALQTEYSLWCRDVESEILPACRQLGVGLVAYSPLGRGYLAGAFDRVEDLAAGDWRRHGDPRLAAANLAHNRAVADAVRRGAAAAGCTPAQLALAWILSRGTDIVPIPGTRSAERLGDNAAAAAIGIPSEQLAALEDAVAATPIAGRRYDDAGMSLVNG